MKLLVTGAAGFIGHHFVEHVFKNTDWSVTALDRLTYAGRLDRLAHLRGPRLEFVFHDFRAPFIGRLPSVDAIVHFGAETHVDRSLENPRLFIESNVMGTFNMLEVARTLEIPFVLVSTDEVFGPAEIGQSHSEKDTIAPSNPYAATKAGAEAMVIAYAHSFGVKSIITRTMNNFGERQHPEKFIPKAIKRIVQGQAVSIHANKHGTIISSRKWLHARNHADAILFLLQGQAFYIPKTWPQVYHIAGEEYNCAEIATSIAAILGKPPLMEFVDFHSARPGHDLRYSLDDSKLRGLGWKPPLDFESSFEKTVRWSVEHPEWLSNG